MSHLIELNSTDKIILKISDDTIDSLSQTAADSLTLTVEYSDGGRPCRGRIPGIGAESSPFGGGRIQRQNL